MSAPRPGRAPHPQNARATADDGEGAVGEDSSRAIRGLGPFSHVFRLSVGDFVAKSLYFAAFIYVARVLGVSAYGVLEFGLSVLTYLLLIADGGLDLWATREAARGADIRRLVARIVPLRLLLACATFTALLALLPVFPDYTDLRAVLVLFGLTLFAQAADLKWAFMGKERTTQVVAGLILAQLVFVGAVFGFVRAPSHLVWIPLFRLTADLSAASFFGYRFVRKYGNVRCTPELKNARDILGPALTMGASRTLALVNYNFDSILLGFMLGVSAVGWYGAAYKPITAILAVPVTYFIGLFPTLSRTHRESLDEFKQVVERSLKLTAIVAAPIGVAGTFLAAPVVAVLYGPEYSNSVPALQVLAWSAGLVILRGNYRQALNAAGQPRLDLRCAVIATLVNLGLNLLWIPRYGIVGAASATVASEIVWLTTASYYFSRKVTAVGLLSSLFRPALAALGLAIYFAPTGDFHWLPRATIGALLYFALLLALHPKRWPRLPG